jgi:hypothetical protein
LSSKVFVREEKKMRVALIASLLIYLSPVTAGAQEGLGQLDFTGKRENRPVLPDNLAHPSGARATCFSLPGNSCNRDDCGSDRERAQLLQSKPDNREGEAYRYSVSFFLPSDFVDVSPTNLMLWEVKPKGSGKPSASFGIIDGHLQFDLSNPVVTQADKMNPEKPLIIKRLGAIPRGRWTEIIIDAKWSRGDDGILRVYHNGRSVIDHRGPNIDSNSTRQQVMYGLYRSFVSRYLSSTGQSQMPLQQACFANVLRQRIRM